MKLSTKEQHQWDIEFEQTNSRVRTVSKIVKNVRDKERSEGPNTTAHFIANNVRKGVNQNNMNRPQPKGCGAPAFIASENQNRRVNGRTDYNNKQKLVYIRIFKKSAAVVELKK